MPFQVKRLVKNNVGLEQEYFEVIQLIPATTDDGKQVMIQATPQNIYEDQLTPEIQKANDEIIAAQNRLIALQEVMANIQPLKQPQKAFVIGQQVIVP